MAMHTDPAFLSARGRALVDSAPMPQYLHTHFDLQEDAYDRATNPDGYIGLCIAENKTVWPLVRDRMSAPLPDLPHSAICYDDMVGCLDFRTRLADFLGERVFGRRFDPDQIAVLAGAGSVLEILFHCIADAGDAVLVPTPSYSGFWADLETRDELTIVPVHTSPDTGFLLTEELLDEAFERSERPVRALLFTNPDNPRGAVADAEHLEMVIGWAERRGIHLVLDEVYALSRHGDATFVSGARLRETLGDRIHLIWAFSKDFGASGLRCGVLVTENEALMDSVAALAYWSVVSGQTQHLLGRMISDDDWVQGYLREMQQGLQASYREITSRLDAAGITHHPAEAGFFMLLDLREHLEAPTWEAEDALWRSIVDEARVNLTPGSACRIVEPGFMRMCFAAQPLDTALVAVDRLATLLG